MKARGELAALIGIENLGPAVLGERLLDRLKAELDFHGGFFRLACAAMKYDKLNWDCHIGNRM